MLSSTCVFKLSDNRLEASVEFTKLLPLTCGGVQNMLNSASAELGTFFCRMTHLQSEFLTPRMMSEVPKSAETLICTVRTRWIFSGKKMTQEVMQIIHTPSYPKYLGPDFMDP